MNQRQLVRRDPAAAAILGLSLAASSGAAGADFGAEFGSAFGDDYGDDFGDDYGADFGAAVAAAGGAQLMVPKPTAQQAIGAWNKQAVKRVHAIRRVAKLDPNRDSSVKVEKYSMSMGDNFVLGATSNHIISTTPDTQFRPQLITANAPTVGFAYLDNLKMANVNVTVGNASEDLFGYGAGAWGKDLDMPTLTPSNRATADVEYSGYVPPGFVAEATYKFRLSFHGPSLLAGGSSSL